MINDRMITSYIGTGRALCPVCGNIINKEERAVQVRSCGFRYPILQKMHGACARSLFDSLITNALKE